MHVIKSDSPFLYLLPLWPILFLGIWAVRNMLRDSRQEKAALRAANWPELQGKVTTSKAVWGHYEVTYEYIMNATLYSGTHVINLSPVGPDHTAQGASRLAAEAKEDLSDFPPGLDVIIKYNPQDPAQSILLCRGRVAETKTRQQEPPEFFTLS